MPHKKPGKNPKLCLERNWKNFGKIHQKNGEKLYILGDAAGIFYLSSKVLP